MKLKTKLILCKDNTYRIKATYKQKGRRITKFYSAQELGVSNVELPATDFRSKILERLSK